MKREITLEFRRDVPVAEDLSELLADQLAFVRDRWVAVNGAGRIIANGHPAGDGKGNGLPDSHD